MSKRVYYHLEYPIGGHEPARREGSMIIPDKYVGIDAMCEYILSKLDLIFAHNIRIDITRIDV